MHAYTVSIGLPPLLSVERYTTHCIAEEYCFDAASGLHVPGIVNNQYASPSVRIRILQTKKLCL